jgi:hypothetical protein
LVEIRTCLARSWQNPGQVVMKCLCKAHASWISLADFRARSKKVPELCLLLVGTSKEVLQKYQPITVLDGTRGHNDTHEALPRLLAQLHRVTGATGRLSGCKTSTSKLVERTHTKAERILDGNIRENCHGNLGAFLFSPHCIPCRACCSQWRQCS